MSCTPNAKDLVDQVLAITPILVALYVAWIAGQQFRTNRNKLRLDLYQRRFQIYETSLSFYQALIASPDDLMSEEFSSLRKTFIKSFRESRFLFDKSSRVFNLLEEFNTKSAKVIGFKLHGKEVLSDPSSFIKWNDEAQEALVRFESLLKELEDAIAPYLDFHKIAA